MHDRVINHQRKKIIEARSDYDLYTIVIGRRNERSYRKRHHAKRIRQFYKFIIRRNLEEI
jgi:hypothetical protein